MFGWEKGGENFVSFIVDTFPELLVCPVEIVEESYHSIALVKPAHDRQEWVKGITDTVLSSIFYLIVQTYLAWW